MGRYCEVLVVLSENRRDLGGVLLFGGFLISNVELYRCLIWERRSGY